MPQAITWTDAQDHTIKLMRAEGSPWDAIALAVGVCRWTTIERGKEIGAKLPPIDFTPSIDMERAPLPAGHVDTWGAMNRGTCLEGIPYPAPRYDRPLRQRLPA